MCPAAIGTQTAGSVVRPAAYNGVVGLKPTYGRLSRRGSFSQSWSIDTPGILVRTVEDAALLLEVLAGHDPEDASTSARPVPAYRQHLNSLRRPPSLGLMRQFQEQSTEQVQVQMEGVVKRFREAGADVRTVAFPGDLAVVLAAHWTIMKADFAAGHQKLFREHSRDYGPHVRGLIETGMLIPAVDYIQALRIRRRFRRQAEDLVASVDALLAPVTGATAPLIEAPAGEATAVPRTGDHAFQMPWSFSGLPVISLPSGIAGDGLPLAIQLIGAPFAEEKLLAVARWCEATLDMDLLPPLG
jgi:aspartyl-tRNA(Asn)/glutamyl-tRNA(Gln) amidotransferase subunit A